MTKQPVKKGDIVEIILDNLAFGGDCVGHLDGLAVFVPGGIPDEKVKVKITEKKKNFARGKLIEVLTPSKERVDPACDVFGVCGGCQLQQMDYQAQLAHKKQIARDALERIGGFNDIQVNPVIGANYPWQYRNKAQFPLTEDVEGKIVAGFFRQGTHQVVVHNNCLIQHPLINRIVSKTLKVLNKYSLSVYDEKKHRGLLRHLIVRVGVSTNQALLTIVTRDRKFPHKKEIAEQLLQEAPELTGVVQNINSQRTNVIIGEEIILIAGREYYIDYIGPIKFAISPGSFFQVNTSQTKKLYDQVLEYAGLTGEEIVIDGYCGIGSIALYLAKYAKEVYGIEVVEQAIRDARKNAGLNNITNCHFDVGKVEEVLPEMLADSLKPDIVVFDPPRKGLDEKVIDTLLSVTPAKIIYVSCNPATLARDLARLADKYKVIEVQTVDMFPQTYHVECVVLLVRKD